MKYDALGQLSKTVNAPGKPPSTTTTPVTSAAWSTPTRPKIASSTTPKAACSATPTPCTAAPAGTTTKPG
ncbi:hypothetical protein CHR29_11195 [Pseudomonas monteilii]|nr:hypothetical protein CHR29_11195 [Pseudomonas monteilii]